MRGPTPEQEKACGAHLIGQHTLYRGTEAEWNARMRWAVGHAAYRLAWHPVWGAFAVYRRPTPEDCARLRRRLPQHTFRFAVVDELNRPCRVDSRLVGFVRDDDLMWRDPFRWMRLRVEAEASAKAAEAAEYDAATDAIIREAEEHVHIASGRRGWHGYGSTGDGWVRPRGMSPTPPIVFAGGA